ncbi:site-specific integrase [Lactococcus petauri]|uniref:Site-specific integrase n=1 Tax=Lactococcus petauri TaxID=1940789 RepID=A0AAJ2IQ66_9LACT|nr:site-specific integrase [Lactococcus petauri]MDG6137568.1 site-specific integrase [Lactococcus petauri]MDT2552921.1 site-specific integrase [Lactococcus petauri]MDT2562465.1 site-specific integrase [Lactococcus petauri]MDT2574727.1 site-specific integrase [Lactococcus petauri]MDT2581098.1 site-specific integrase [Lactococcus petauri]
MEISIQSVIQEMLFDNKARGLSKNTIIFREKTRKVFSVFFLYQNDILNISEIKPIHIKQYLVDRLECGYSETSVNAQLGIIRAFVCILCIVFNKEINMIDLANHINS